MEKKEISIKELFNVLWARKYLILIFAGAFFIVSAAGSFIYDKTSSQVSTIVTLQWNGSGSGEHPDGTRFDYNEVIQPYIISNALDQIDNTDLDSGGVREEITITPILPNNVQALLIIAIENGEDTSFFATDFKLTIDNGRLDISVDEGADLLNAVIDQFRIEFERKFIQQVSVLDFTDTDFDDFDYIDSFTILDTQVALIESIMNLRIEQDPGFVSSTTGISFSDILVRTNLLKQLELVQIESRTNTYLLTKDSDYLITKLSYDIVQMQLDLDKATSNQTSTQALIDNYAGSVTTILIPGMDASQVLEIDTYYNILIENLIEIQYTISELEQDIIYNQIQIDKLEGNDPTFILTVEKRAEEIAKVEAAIDSADAALELIVSDSNTLLVEYNAYITSNIVKPLMTPQYESNVSVALISLVGLVIGAGIGTVVVLFKHDWK